MRKDIEKYKKLSDELVCVPSGFVREDGTEIMAWTLKSLVEGIQKENFVTIIPVGLWDKSGEIEFWENTTQSSASRVKGTKDNAEIKKNEKAVIIKTSTIDEIKQTYNIPKIDFIKMDIEGSELKALKGGEKTILSDRPQMAISIYHSMNDFVSIPLYLNNILENYTFHIGHYSYNHCETVLYAIPDELTEQKLSEKNS